MHPARRRGVRGVGGMEVEATGEVGGGAWLGLRGETVVVDGEVRARGAARSDRWGRG